MRSVTLSTKVHLVKAMVFPAVMYGCESWTIKKAEHWCFWTVGLEKTLESPLDCKEIQPVHSKGDQSWVFIERTDVEAETPVFWPPDANSWLIWKDPDVGKDWRQEEKGTIEDEMVRWHHRLNGHEFGETPGVGDGQGGLGCCGSWDRRVRNDWPTKLNCTEGLQKVCQFQSSYCRLLVKSILLLFGKLLKNKLLAIRMVRVVFSKETINGFEVIKRG